MRLHSRLVVGVWPGFAKFPRPVWTSVRHAVPVRADRYRRGRVSGRPGSLRRRPAIGGPAGANWLVIVAALGGPLLFLAVAYRFGPVMAIGVVVAPLLLVNARVTLLLCMLIFLVCEGDPGWGLASISGKAYSGGPFVSPFEMTLWLAFAAMLVHVWVSGLPFRLPDPFAVPLALAAVALFFGLVNGSLSDEVQAFAVKSNVETIAPLFLVPIIVVNVVRTREDLILALKIFAAVAVFKSVLGLVLLAVKPGEPSPGVPPLTYYEPTTNWITMAFLLAVAAARLQRVKLSNWIWASTPFVFACLLLSYRRTYWVAATAGLLIVLVLASGVVGRRLLVPAAVLILIAGAVVVSSGATTQFSGPIVKRAQSLDPSKLKANEQDRYRLAERDNVLRELRAHPLTGIGVGVPWSATEPLPFETRFGRQYTHTAFLWFWLRMGAMGAIAYLVLMISAIWCGLFVWRRHPDRRVGVAALAGGIGVLGLWIVELASTVIGPDQRGTTLFALVLGLLSVAYLQTKPATKPARTPSERTRRPVPAASAAADPIA
jgi:hypothetical protein